MSTERSGLRSVPYRSWNLMHNLGDSITLDLLAKLFAVDPFYGTPEQDHLLGVGSIINMATPMSYVWGAGILNPKEEIPDLTPSRVLAVRGHHTLKLLKKKYNSLIVPVGDPGVLVSALFADKKNKVKKYRAGIVVHHNSIWKIDTSWRDIFKKFHGSTEICLIDLLTNKLDPLAKIGQCEVVISQSLHGLIFAEALGCKALWWSEKFGDPVWEFKFHDWYSTTACPQSAPRWIGDDIETLIESARCQESQIKAEDLTEAFPLEQLCTANASYTIDFVNCRLHNPMVVRHFQLCQFFDQSPQVCEALGMESLINPIIRSVISSCAEPPYLLMQFGEYMLGNEDSSRLIQMMNWYLDYDAVFLHKWNDIEVVGEMKKWYSTDRICFSDDNKNVGFGVLVRPGRWFQWNSRVGSVYIK